MGSRFYTSVAIHKNNILLRGYEDGSAIKTSVEYKPFLFRSHPIADGTYRTIFDQPVARMDFDSMREARDFIKRYEGVDGVNLYGMNRFAYPFIFENYPGQIEFDQSIIRVAFIDIEVAADQGFPSIDDAKFPVTAITIKQGNLIYAFGCGAFTTDDPNITYYQCIDERQLLYRFLDLWTQLAPDVVSGWNIDTFDIPYLVNRITNVIGEVEAKRLSPWRILTERTVEIHGKDHTIYTPVGIAVLDYLRLYKKFTFSQQESYSLNNIANVELGEKKTDYSEYGSLQNLYKENHQKFMVYNIRDVLLVDRIDQKKKLLELVFSLAYEAKVNLEDTLTSVTLWDVIIHNYLLEQGMVVPFNEQAEWREFEGAFVKEPRCDLYNWVISFDLTSLYPMLIQQFNISPETYKGQIEERMSIDKILAGGMREHIDDLIKHNLSAAANLCLYSKDLKGFMPKLMERFFNLRKEAKDKQIVLENEYEQTKDKSLLNRIGALQTRQMVIKVVLNSLYGVLGNRYFRWFQVEHAEAITWSGQLVIQWAAQHMNAYLNKVMKTTNRDYIIAMDTDSLYITLNDLVVSVFPDGAPKEKVVEFLHKACKTKLTQVLNDAFDDLAKYMNAYENKMNMKREIIAEKGIWTGKKRYALSVWDKEGVRYEKPKTKITGLEVVRSTTPACCKAAIKEAIELMIYGTEQQLITHIAAFRRKYMNELSFADIAIPTGVNGLSKYANEVTIYTSGTPQHIKAGLIYNHMHKKKNVMAHPPIYDGDKIKLFLLKTPNPSHNDAIAVPAYIPEEFNIEKYIDREAMFERSFLSPVKKIADIIKWQTKKENRIL